MAFRDPNTGQYQMGSDGFRGFNQNPFSDMGTSMPGLFESRAGFLGRVANVEYGNYNQYGLSQRGLYGNGQPFLGGLTPPAAAEDYMLNRFAQRGGMGIVDASNSDNAYQTVNALSRQYGIQSPGQAKFSSLTNASGVGRLGAAAYYTSDNNTIAFGNGFGDQSFGTVFHETWHAIDAQKNWQQYAGLNSNVNELSQITGGHFIQWGQNPAADITYQDVMQQRAPFIGMAVGAAGFGAFAAAQTFGPMLPGALNSFNNWARTPQSGIMRIGAGPGMGSSNSPMNFNTGVSPWRPTLGNPILDSPALNNFSVGGRSLLDSSTFGEQVLPSGATPAFNFLAQNFTQQWNRGYGSNEGLITQLAGSMQPPEINQTPGRPYLQNPSNWSGDNSTPGSAPTGGLASPLSAGGFSRQGSAPGMAMGILSGLGSAASIASAWTGQTDDWGNNPNQTRQAAVLGTVMSSFLQGNTRRIPIEASRAMAGMDMAVVRTQMGAANVAESFKSGDFMMPVIAAQQMYNYNLMENGQSLAIRGDAQNQFYGTWAGVETFNAVAPGLIGAGAKAGPWGALGGLGASIAVSAAASTGAGFLSSLAGGDDANQARITDQANTQDVERFKIMTADAKNLEASQDRSLSGPKAAIGMLVSLIPKVGMPVRLALNNFFDSAPKDSARTAANTSAYFGQLGETSIWSGGGKVPSLASDEAAMRTAVKQAMADSVNPNMNASSELTDLARMQSSLDSKIRQDVLSAGGTQKQATAVQAEFEASIVQDSPRNYSAAHEAADMSLPMKQKLGTQMAEQIAMRMDTGERVDPKALWGFGATWNKGVDAIFGRPSDRVQHLGQQLQSAIKQGPLDQLGQFLSSAHDMFFGQQGIGANPRGSLPSELYNQAAIVSRQTAIQQQIVHPMGALQGLEAQRSGTGFGGGEALTPWQQDEKARWAKQDAEHEADRAREGRTSTERARTMYDLAAHPRPNYQNLEPDYHEYKFMAGDSRVMSGAALVDSFDKAALTLTDEVYQKAAISSQNWKTYQDGALSGRNRDLKLAANASDPREAADYRMDASNYEKEAADAGRALKGIKQDIGKAIKQITIMQEESKTNLADDIEYRGVQQDTAVKIAGFSRSNDFVRMRMNGLLQKVQNKEISQDEYMKGYADLFGQQMKNDYGIDRAQNEAQNRITQNDIAGDERLITDPQTPLSQVAGLQGRIDANKKLITERNNQVTKTENQNWLFQQGLLGPKELSETKVNQVVEPFFKASLGNMLDGHPDQIAAASYKEAAGGITKLISGKVSAGITDMYNKYLHATFPDGSMANPQLDTQAAQDWGTLQNQTADGVSMGTEAQGPYLTQGPSLSGFNNYAKGNMTQGQSGLMAFSAGAQGVSMGTGAGEAVWSATSSSYNPGLGATGGAMGGAMGALVGAAIGSAGGPVGMAAGALIGGFIGGAGGSAMGIGGGPRTVDGVKGIPNFHAGTNAAKMGMGWYGAFIDPVGMLVGALYDSAHRKENRAKESAAVSAFNQGFASHIMENLVNPDIPANLEGAYNQMIEQWQSERKSHLTGKAGLQDNAHKLAIGLEAEAPYRKELTDNNGLAGWQFAVQTQQALSISQLGPFQGQAVQTFSGTYDTLMKNLAATSVKGAITPANIGLAQSIFTSEFNNTNQQISRQVDYSGVNLDLEKRQAAVNQQSRQINTDQMSYTLSMFDRNSSISIEQTLGTLQRNNNRQAQVDLLKADQAFNKDILMRQVATSNLSDSLQTDKANENVREDTQSYNDLIASQKNLMDQQQKMYSAIGSTTDALFRMLQGLQDVTAALKNL